MIEGVHCNITTSTNKICQ